MNYQAFKQALVLISALAGCQAQAQPPTPEFAAVFAVISSEQVLTLSFPAIMVKLKGICTERKAGDGDYVKRGNVSCTEAAAVNRLTLSGSDEPSLSMVQSSFKQAENCAYMKAELSRRYGKPHSSDGVCASEWRITPKKKPARIIKLAESKKSNLVFFTFQEEESP